jgi:predicted ArsR family transcriptional regulator
MGAQIHQRSTAGRYPFVPGSKDNDTGKEAALKYAPQAPTRRAQVLQGLAAGPATAEEIGERIGLHWYLTRPRLSELKAMGEVVETGERGAGALGGVVKRWRLTTATERAVFNRAIAVKVENLAASL